MAYYHLHMSKFPLTEVLRGLTRSQLVCWGLTRHLASKENKHKVWQLRAMNQEEKTDQRYFTVFLKLFLNIKRNTPIVMTPHIKRSTGYIAEAQTVLYTYICHIQDSSAVKSEDGMFLFQQSFSAFNGKSHYVAAIKHFRILFTLTHRQSFHQQ